MVLVLLCQNLDTVLAAGHCDTALVIQLALLNELLACLPT
jgi:hypothetical protein